MNLWYQNLLLEATNVVERFKRKSPANSAEEIIFGAIRSLFGLFINFMMGRFSYAL